MHALKSNNPTVGQYVIGVLSSLVATLIIALFAKISTGAENWIITLVLGGCAMTGALIVSKRYVEPKLMRSNTVAPIFIWLAFLIVIGTLLSLGAAVAGIAIADFLRA
ncbi:hypothetical protein QN355_11670 [Cryobacterium sp. 10S3]|uniref:hypothetical protein n=1 Tax=Cryobacterium sp. 10S3 TaxID=3048582 RepID=UPI002AC927C7|nr:hypothetical protein [Cryobacterium sp. 10S3]MEB0287212.1 hypothetical protein [Cryobacterium sp. 10S3]WPX14167.1 hypothetical protein RHM57_01990 [Cryobacterium sp. 10S3]